jgi:hypothetical protein
MHYTRRNGTEADMNMTVDTHDIFQQQCKNARYDGNSSQKRIFGKCQLLPTQVVLTQFKCPLLDTRCNCCKVKVTVKDQGHPKMLTFLRKSDSDIDILFALERA